MLVNLPGNKIRKKNSYEVKLVTFKQIHDLKKNNKLCTPKFQTDLDIDKINEMIELYKLNPDYLYFKNKIVIGVIMNESDKISKTYSKLYILDGQHRIEMASELYEKEKIQDSLEFCYYYIYNNEEMLKIFNEINKDSYRNIKYIKLDEFNKNTYDDLKTYLLETKKDMFAEKKKETNKKYTIVEFIDILSDKKYLDKFSNIEDIKKDLELKNKLFYQKIEYFEYYCDKLLCKFYKEEEINIENQIIYPLKNNNFIDFLLNDKIIPDHKFKTIKTKIIPKTRPIACVTPRTAIAGCLLLKLPP